MNVGWWSTTVPSTLNALIANVSSAKKVWVLILPLNSAMPTKLTIVSWVVFALGVCFLIAGSVMLGVGIHKANQKPTPGQCHTESTHKPPTFDRSTISKTIQENINADANVRQNLRDFTAKAHIAGTQANLDVANMIANKWKSYGLEDVHLVSYDVLLSYPNYEKQNTLTIWDAHGNVVYKTDGVSPSIVQEEQNDNKAAFQWLAFSKPGTVTADVVYVGKGDAAAYRQMKTAKIDVKGKIALIRYGGAFRGDKVKLAEQNGAIGALLYCDPQDYAPEGYDEANTYPNTIYMPPEGVQRGSIYNGDGDPLSPLYPSKPNLFKSGSVEKSRANYDLSDIPAMPISYTAALEILKRMNPPKSAYQGSLNTTYNWGPGLVDGMQTTMAVDGKFETKTIQNVVGYIYGSEEPDRYVILGNHYDAWTYGAMDPNAGTAVLAEVARATMQTMNETGWRPARTLMFANWDAEEFGLFGSTEFVEEFSSILSNRAIMYINMDCLKGNQTIYVQASPELSSEVMGAAKNVANPRQDEIAAGRPTVYDTWLNRFPSNDPFFPNTTLMEVPMGGSDQKSFLDYFGIPSVNFYYIEKQLTYPLYHTYYETPFASEHLIDTDRFSIHRAIGQYWIELALRYADSPVTPFSFSTLARKIVTSYFIDLMQKIDDSGVDHKYTVSAVQQLNYADETANQLIILSKKWEAQYSTFDTPAIERATQNGRNNEFERCFVNPRGTPTDPTARHVLFSVDKDNSYAGSVMPQVYSVLNEMIDTTDPVTLQALGNNLAQQISIVHYSIQCASNAISKYI